MRESLAAFACGVLFAIGLALSGMTQPAKVLAFLDFTGAWDPSLLLVMGGAIAVYMPLFRRVVRMQSPFLAEFFDLPAMKRVDVRLVAGAALFGVGWGLSGYCPGPAVVSLASAGTQAPIFVAAMAAGMLLWSAFQRLAASDG